MKYNRLIYIVLTLVISTFTSSALLAQNKDEKQKKETKQEVNKEEKTVDLYKEFDPNSFAGATKKLKDSTTLSQHLIGVKVGYGISNVAFSQDIEHKGFKSPKNIGIYYTYYHSLWNSMPYFGIQTGLEYSELGYTHIYNVKNEAGEIVSTTEDEQKYQAFELPLLSQFRVDFWKMRLFLNVGPYGYYITSADMEEGIPSTTNRAGIGIMGGGGLAFVLKPLEFHLECNYRYALSHFCDPEIYSSEYWLYTHSSQLTISLGVFFRLGNGKKSK